MKYIITETQYKRMFLIEHYPGTKKPMGADGVDENMFKEILTLMKTTYSGETGYVQTATGVESKGKVESKGQKDIIGKAIDLMNVTCKKNNKFNNERIPNFCRDINEILHSDNDNVFSRSYGWT